MTKEMKDDLQILLFETQSCISDIVRDDKPSNDMLHLVNYIVAIGVLLNGGFDKVVYPNDPDTWEERLMFNNDYDHNLLLNNKEIFDRYGITVPQELRK